MLPWKRVGFFFVFHGGWRNENCVCFPASKLIEKNHHGLSWKNRFLFSFVSLLMLTSGFNTPDKKMGKTIKCLSLLCSALSKVCMCACVQPVFFFPWMWMGPTVSHWASLFGVVLLAHFPFFCFVFLHDVEVGCANNINEKKKNKTSPCASFFIFLFSPYFCLFFPVL